MYSRYFQESLDRNDFPKGYWKISHPGYDGQKLLFSFDFAGRNAYISGDRGKRPHVKIENSNINDHYSLKRTGEFKKIGRCKTTSRRLKKWGKRLQKSVERFNAPFNFTGDSVIASLCK